MTNKYGVPYHEYEITLLDGSVKTVNVGYEEDWGDIQGCVPGDKFEGDWLDKVGLGNDADGHIEIVKVVDIEDGQEIEPMKWAEERVWIYIDNYSC